MKNILTEILSFISNVVKAFISVCKEMMADAWSAIKETQLWKTHRQETFAVLIAGFIFGAANWIGNKYAVGSAFFDIPSQIESLAWSAVRFATAIALAWIGLRVMLPPIYQYLIKGLYPGFETLPEREKRTATLALVITFLLCATMALKGGAATNSNEIRTALIKDLNTTLNIRETTPNAGKEVTFFFKTSRDLHPGSMVCSVRQLLSDQTRSTQSQQRVVTCVRQSKGYNMDTKTAENKTPAGRRPYIFQQQTKESWTRGLLRKYRPRWLVCYDRGQYQWGW